MSVLTPKVTAESVIFDELAGRSAARSLRQDYAAADPFPHIVMDDFLHIDLLRRVVAEFPTRRSGRFSDENSDLKTGYQLEAIESVFITNLMAAFNSCAFVRFLEELTGIYPLIPDPHYAGGGLHETARGGYLKIHSDFNQHPEYELERRLNLIIFLNEDWQQAYGGELELWSRDMTECRVKVVPEMGRAVVFNTTDESWHGHPDPLMCPETRYRRSIALYYFSTLRESAIERRTTHFVARGGTDLEALPRTKQRLVAVARDWCPPAIRRNLRRLR